MNASQLFTPIAVSIVAFGIFFGFAPIVIEDVACGAGLTGPTTEFSELEVRHLGDPEGNYYAIIACRDALTARKALIFSVMGTGLVLGVAGALASRRPQRGDRETSDEELDARDNEDDHMALHLGEDLIQADSEGLIRRTFRPRMPRVPPRDSTEPGGAPRAGTGPG